MIAAMDKLLKTLVSILTWGVGVLLPAVLLVSGRRAIAVAVLSVFAVLLVVGWRWRAFLWWSVAGIAFGVALGLAVGWQFAFRGQIDADDQSGIIFLLTIPAGIAVGLVLAGAAFRRWDPRAE
jgi:hypothetical protein